MLEYSECRDGNSMLVFKRLYEVVFVEWLR